MASKPEEAGIDPRALDALLDRMIETHGIRLQTGFSARDMGADTKRSWMDAVGSKKPAKR